MEDLKVRCGVIVVSGGKVAVIRKTLGSEVFYNFPGGRRRDGETPEETAAREGYEELGTRVRLGRLLATWESDWDGTHYYFAAAPAGDGFGTGSGEEMGHGCTAMWLTPEDLREADIRPKDVFLALPFHALDSLKEPLRLKETIRRRTRDEK